MGIEPTEDVSTTPPTGFEVQAHHQTQSAPTQVLYFITIIVHRLVHKAFTLGQDRPLRLQGTKESNRE